MRGPFSVRKVPEPYAQVRKTLTGRRSKSRPKGKAASSWTVDTVDVTLVQPRIHLYLLLLATQLQMNPYLHYSELIHKLANPVNGRVLGQIRDDHTTRLLRQNDPNLLWFRRDKGTRRKRKPQSCASPSNIHLTLRGISPSSLHDQS